MAHKADKLEREKIKDSGAMVDNGKYARQQLHKVNMTEDEELKLVEYVRQKNAHSATENVPTKIFEEYKKVSESERGADVLRNAYNCRLSMKKKTIAEIDAWIRQRRIELNLPVEPEPRDYKKFRLTPGAVLVEVVRGFRDVVEVTPEETSQVDNRVKAGGKILKNSEVDEDAAKAKLLEAFRTTLDLIGA